MGIRYSRNETHRSGSEIVSAPMSDTSRHRGWYQLTPGSRLLSNSHDAVVGSKYVTRCTIILCGFIHFSKTFNETFVEIFEKKIKRRCQFWEVIRPHRLTSKLNAHDMTMLTSCHVVSIYRIVHIMNLLTSTQLLRDLFFFFFRIIFKLQLAS